jgi:hypothetical protein
MRRIAEVVVVILVAVACTRSVDPTASPPDGCVPGTPACDTVVSAGGVNYVVQCAAVAEDLTDVELGAQPGIGKIRAITGIAHAQGVAVRADDPEGCGVWTLALARDLSGAAEIAVREEVARGVERFGAASSPIPRDDGH